MATFYRLLIVSLLFAISVHSQLHNETATSASPPAQVNLTDVELTKPTTTTTITTTTTTTTTIKTTTATPAVSAGSTNISTSAAPPSPKPERDISPTQLVKVEALSLAPVNCTIALENWITSDWNILLDKISANSSSDIFLSSNFCDLKPSNYTCLNDSKLPSDRNASQKLVSIEALKKDLCNNGLKNLLALAVNGSSCLVAATNVTKECLASTKNYRSPVEFVLRANFSNAAECKNVTNANGCITNKIQNTQSCNADQQRIWGQVVRHLVPPSCDPESSASVPSTQKNSGFSLSANVLLYFLPLVVVLKIGSIDA